MYGIALAQCTRLECLALLGQVLSVAVFLLPSLGLRAADPGETGRQQRQQAEGWLQLKQDQKTFREAAEPLDSGAAQSLDRLDRSQQGRALDIEQRQRQSLDLDRILRRNTDVERPVSVPSDVENRRQLERHRLEMRIQRETLSPGLR